MSVESPASTAPPSGIPAWSLVTALAFVLLWVLLLILTIAAFQACAAVVIAVSRGLSLEDASLVVAETGGTGLAVVNATCMFLTWLVTFALIRRLLGRFPLAAVRQALGLVRPTPNWSLLVGAVAGLVLLVAGQFLVALLRTSTEPPPIENLLDTPLGTVAVVVMAIGIAPVAEEVFFRGFVYPPMERRFSLGTAMGVNGLVFTFVHILTYGRDVAYLPPVFLLGFALAGLRSWTGSVMPCIIAHFVFNATSLLGYLLVGPTPPSTGT